MNSKCKVCVLKGITFGLFMLQVNSKAEEAVPGVTTGMILTLRERFCEIQNIFNLLLKLLRSNG